MKIQSIKLAALAFAGLAAFAQSANAQSTVTTTAGDLILGVYQTNTAAHGYGNSYEVDLGSLTNFSSTVSNYSLAGSVSITDLNAIFGADLSQTSWFVVGTQGSGALSLNTPGATTPYHNALLITDVAASAPTTVNAEANTLATPASQIGGLQGGMSGLQSTSNSAYAELFATATPANAPQYSLPSNITTQDAFASTSNFYLLNPYSNSSRDGSKPGTVTLLGDFQFVGGTNFTYNPAAVPEPSTYALMGLGALMLVMMARRRMASNS